MLRLLLGVGGNCITLLCIASHPLIYAKYNARVAKGYCRALRMLLCRRAKRSRSTVGMIGAMDAGEMNGDVTGRSPRTSRSGAMLQAVRNFAASKTGNRMSTSGVAGTSSNSC